MQMCRACLQRGSGYVLLDDGKESYRHKLTVCVPEMNIDVLKNPALCDECSIRLNEAYKFRCTCLESEKKINENLTLENSLGDVAISEEYVKERKRRLSEARLNNPNDAVKQEIDADDDGVENKRRKSCENLTGELNEIKQEPEIDDYDESSKESSMIAIKEEQDFFYSEYEVDSEENNIVTIANRRTDEAKTFKILTEHSYSASLETVSDECDSNKVCCAVCKELYHERFMPAHVEAAHKSGKSARPMRTQDEGYLSVSMDTERKFMCRYCNKIFKESVGLYDHINLMHAEELTAGKEVLCKICNLSFDEKIIKRHLEVHDADKVEVNADSASHIKLICKVCGEIFNDEKMFTSHYQMHKQSMDLTTCTICGETYDQNSAGAHMEFHNTVEEIILNGDIDEATFSSPNVDLNSTGGAGTSDSNTSNYTCCDEDFSNLYLLHLHTTRVHGYVCYVCDIKFPNRYALAGHFRVHNEHKSHQCKNCGKYFAQRGNLLRHTHFVHDCVMPYKCDKCGERFRRNKYLEEHMRSHAQKYVCTDCDRVFAEMRLLRKHMGYHMPRPHQCDVCNTMFTAKSSLVRHKRDIHKVKITGRRCYGLGDVVLGSTESNE